MKPFLEGDRDAAGKAEIVRFPTQSGLVIVDIAGYGAHAHALGKPEIDADFGGQDIFIGAFDVQISRYALPDFRRGAKADFQSFANDEGEVGIGHATLSFPGVAGADFEAQRHGVGVDRLITEDDAGSNPVVEIGNVVGEEAQPCTEVNAVREEAVVLATCVEVLHVLDLIVFAVSTADVQEIFVGLADHRTADVADEEEVFGIAFSDAEAESRCGLPDAFRAARSGDWGGNVALFTHFLRGCRFGIGIAQAPAEAGDDLEVVLLEADGWFAIVNVANGSAPPEVSGNASGHRSFSHEGKAAKIREIGEVLEGLNEARIFRDRVAKAFGEAQRGVSVFDAALFFPGITGAGFEGEAGLGFVNHTIAEGGGDLVTVIEVGDLVVGQRVGDTDVEAVAQVAIHLQAEEKGVATGYFIGLGVVITTFTDQLPAVPTPFGIETEAKAEVVGITAGQGKPGVKIDLPTCIGGGRCLTAIVGGRHRGRAGENGAESRQRSSRAEEEGFGYFWVFYHVVVFLGFVLGEKADGKAFKKAASPSRKWKKIKPSGL
jgi:hypothetical protein